MFELQVAFFLRFQQENSLRIQERFSPDAVNFQVLQHVPSLLEDAPAELQVDVISGKIRLDAGLECRGNKMTSQIMMFVYFSLTKLYNLARSLGAESSIVAENSITFVI